MPFSIRKRTRGKSSWLNFSVSKSKGVNASYSQKLGNLTLNVSKRGGRATYNFGNGIRWTSSSSKKKLTKKSVAYEKPVLREKVVKPSSEVEFTLGEKVVIGSIITIVVLIIQLYLI